jgi:cellulose synthase/poly-beta-1,6-N-acetylglucosamine synthase-like glycosyltransferase
MNDMMDYFFGPLSKNYCIWFYFLSILGFFLLTFFLLSSVIYGIQKRKGIEYYASVSGIAIGYAIFYFQNRLLHTMCVHK